LGLHFAPERKKIGFLLSYLIYQVKKPSATLK
jgi:hypothetical protein